MSIIIKRKILAERSTHYQYCKIHVKSNQDENKNEGYDKNWLYRTFPHSSQS